MSAAKKKARALFNEAVFKRDNDRCVFCPVTENLDAHHIIDRHLMPNGGYVKENGITLCSEHHRQAEDGQPTPDELYARIDSSYEKAFVASVRLRL
jgi:hypothetical protein